MLALQTMVGGGVYDLPDERSVHDSSHNANSDGLLLRRLSTSRTAPTQNERVDAICSNGEDDHGGVTSRHADGRASDKETNDGDTLGDGYVPCALVELARRPGDCDGDRSGNEVGWACQDKCHELGET
jgi:hypothetical protein